MRECRLFRLVGLVAAIGMASLVCACQATSGGTGALDVSGATPPTPTTGNQVIAQVQSTTATVCKFVPTAQVVANILTTLVGKGNDLVEPIGSIAAGICDSVASAQSSTRKGVTRAGATYGAVYGVPIKGKFVN